MTEHEFLPLVKNGLLGSWTCSFHQFPNSLTHLSFPLNGVLPSFKTYLEVSPPPEALLDCTSPHSSLPTQLHWPLKVLTCIPFSGNSGLTLGVPTYLPKIGYISLTGQQTRAASLYAWCLAQRWHRELERAQAFESNTHCVTQATTLTSLGPFSPVLLWISMRWWM